MESWERELISEKDFVDVWGAHAKDSGDLFFFEEVKDQPVHQIWSVTNSGGETPDHWIAAPGFHVVNVLGYVITRRAWSSDTPDAFYMYDDFE